MTSDQFDFLASDLSAYLGEFGIGAHIKHLFVDSHRDTRKLGGVFDQREQLTAASARSGPSDPNGGPDFSGLLQRTQQSLIARREPILDRGSVAGIRELKRTGRLQERRQARVAFPDSLDHGREGVQWPQGQRKARSPEPTPNAQRTSKPHVVRMRQGRCNNKHQRGRKAHRRSGVAKNPHERRCRDPDEGAHDDRER